MDNWEKYGLIRAMRVNGISDRKIAKALNAGRDTVKKYRDGAVTPDDRVTVPRKSPLREAVGDEIARMLKENAELPRKQRLSAKDMWEILVSEHGIAISYPHAKRIVREIRDAQGETFVPLEHEIGDCVQVDWLEDVIAFINGIRTFVQVLIFVLAYSGAICAFVYPDKTALSFMHGHVKYFDWLQGVARRHLYDLLKTAALSGSGKNAKTQETFDRFALHYSFVPEFCNRASGWEKSYAENGVKITRNIVFTPIPRVDSFEELQNYVSAKLLHYNMTHKIQSKPRKIWDMFLEERATLAPLPFSSFEVNDTAQTQVYPDQTVRYGNWRYSVPYGYVGKSVTLRVSPFNLSVYHRGMLLYKHEKQRQGGQDQYILDHYLEILSRKPRAAGQALPIKKGVMPTECKAFLELCPAKDKNRQLVEIMLLARDVGEERVIAALRDAAGTGKPTAELVRYYLYGQQAPNDAFEIEHNDLSGYDKLLKEVTDE